MRSCKTCEEFSCGANGSDYVSMKCGGKEGFVRVAPERVSSPNAAELVEELRNLKYAKRTTDCGWAKQIEMRSIMLDAADAIEADRMEIAGLRMRRNELYKKIDQLEDQNAKLKAERDAAVTDIPRTCWNCKWNKSKEKCKNCNRLLQYFPAWEWRGVKEEEK